MQLNLLERHNILIHKQFEKKIFNIFIILNFFFYIFPFNNFAFNVTTAPPAHIITNIVPKTISELDFDVNDKVLF